MKAMTTMTIDLGDSAIRVAELAIEMSLPPEGVVLIALAERMSSDGSCSTSPACEQLLRLADEVEAAPPVTEADARLLAERIRYFAQLTTTLPMIDLADMAAAAEATAAADDADDADAGAPADAGTGAADGAAADDR
ncbi:hypothetical protein [Bosea sp. RAC05]|uniref:hypothetical protein n=1 Tax=Bosea sp. RAC05 TaxID=1842539 RepID=UPI00083DE85B|nr:hypothetical protein [Bosea sp. RAC05]AOG03160.1 hypothetical protein BSY19_4878 [Bosea sp. RAC05]